MSRPILGMERPKNDRRTCDIISRALQELAVRTGSERTAVKMFHMVRGTISNEC